MYFPLEPDQTGPICLNEKRLQKSTKDRTKVLNLMSKNEHM